MGFRSAESKIIQQIGKNDNSGAEFALAPNDYGRFIDKDFGQEDQYFLIGTSDIKNRWPCIMPGTIDYWGVTDSKSGRRSSAMNILLGLNNVNQTDKWKLTIDILDCNPKNLPLLKVIVNEPSWNYKITVIRKHSKTNDEINDKSEY